MEQSLFNKQWWNNWSSTCKKINLDLNATLFIKKINSKCVIDLNVKFKTVKFLEDNIEENIDLVMACSMKEIIDKLKLIKIKNFSCGKDYQNSKTSHILGAGICKRHIW